MAVRTVKKKGACEALKRPVISGRFSQCQEKSVRSRPTSFEFHRASPCQKGYFTLVALLGMKKGATARDAV